jgi:CRISPR/Cas system-associated exonuclease Cas4 (RecB family)
MTPAQMVLDMLDRHFAAEAEKSAKAWDESKLHASDVATHCNRQLWLRLHGAKRSPTSTSRLILFQDGLDKQSMVEAAAEAIGLGPEWVYTGRELPLPPIPLAGIERATYHPDLVFFSATSGDYRWIVVEVKRVRSRAMTHGLPKKGHIWQLQEYMAAYARVGWGSVLGVVLYLAGDGQAQPLAFDVDLATEEERDQRWLEIAPALAEEKPPILPPKYRKRENKASTALYAKDPWPCDYCDYRGVSCPGAMRAVMAALDVEPPLDHDEIFFGYQKGDRFEPHENANGDLARALHELMEPAERFWKGRLIDGEEE